ncbi:MAG: hypothetical protein ABH952_03505 [Candidatus Omnitrophota bacterium]
MAIILGIKGKEWAWQNKKWESIEYFQKIQKLWSYWAIGVILVAFLTGVLAALIVPRLQDITQ